MPRTRSFQKLLMGVALAGLGCSGAIDKSDTAAPGGQNPGGQNPGGQVPGGQVPGGQDPGGQPQVPGVPGKAVFHRLNRVEYNNTIRDLLGDASNPGKDFAADQDSARSGYFTGGSISANDATHLLEATEKLATGAMQRLPELVPCKPVPAAAADQDACAGQFIAQFGKRAFRRPLTADETSSFKTFYAAQRSGGHDFANALRMVISGMLLSPQFLYRWEVIPEMAVRDGTLVRYNSYEMASRLSYLIWASMPDDAGFTTAEQNKLGTPDQIEAEVRRLLKDPRAKQAVGDFFTQWLGVTELATVPKDPKVYPTYSPELVASMLAETAAFAAHTVTEGDGRLGTIFTSPQSFIDAKLAVLYGNKAVTATTLTQAMVNPAERAGILTHGSFLAGHASADESNPTRRGKVLADRVICQEIALPPDDVPDPEKPMAGVSVRERFEKHSTQPCATACHGVMDPLGFAFENYNGMGAYQSMDAGKPVNATGKLTLDGKTVEFKNALELNKILSESKQVGACMARQFLRYALRRKEVVGDEQALATAEAAFAGKSYDLRELMVALTKTKSFTHRTPSSGEVLP
jgi:hypothetical protein